MVSDLIGIISEAALNGISTLEPNHSQNIKDAGQWFSVSVPYDVCSMIAGDQKNSRLYHCMNDNYLIEVYDPNGNLFRKVDRPDKRWPTNKEDKEQYLAGFTRSSELHLSLIDKHVQMPPLKTVTDNMIVDDLGNLWVETNEEKVEKGKTYTAFDIFNEDGV